ncbi:MAG TPA: citryl-CoA lyase [Steroidobacteraceae bacterium]
MKRSNIRYAKYYLEGFRHVKIGSQGQRSSAISASNAETILVRGLDLAQQLMGHVSFTEHFWLLVTGSLPSAAQRRILDSTLVAIAEHGLVPSVQVSRMTLAAAPEALQGAVAAGILGCGSVVLGSSEAAGRFLNEVREPLQSGVPEQEAIAAVVREYRAQRRAIPGYGHPLHSGADPRAQRLLQIAAECGSAGTCCALATQVEQALPQIIGKHLPLNVSGAIPAVLLDAGFPLLALKGIPLLARTAGLVAHLLEEQLRPIGFLMSHAAAAAVDYDGHRPDGFEPSDS